jgi:hypothetical protein
MFENPRKMLPPDQDPNPDDEAVEEKVTGDSEFHFNEGELSIGKRVEVPVKRSVPDMMGKIRERDASAKNAEEWLDKNDSERSEL